jgi:hypothetical protein
MPVSGVFSGAERNEAEATSARAEVVSGCEAKGSEATLKRRSQAMSRVGSLRLSTEFGRSQQRSAVLKFAVCRLIQLRDVELLAW